MRLGKQCVLSFLALVLTLLFFEFTNVDLFVQNYLYDFTHQKWLLVAPRDELIHFIFYDGIKRLLVVFALLLLVVLLFYRNKLWVKNRFPKLVIVLLSLLLVPSAVSAIKSVTNVACPKALTIYGGETSYISVFKHYTKEQRPEKPQKCFPAAHASAGFALLSLCFLMDTRRKRAKAIIGALIVGWSMGGYKMLIGDHFLSHTIVSMELAWLLINLIAVIVESRYLSTIISRNSLYGDSMST